MTRWVDNRATAVRSLDRSRLDGIRGAIPVIMLGITLPRNDILAASVDPIDARKATV
jgi:hypothetical protein